MDGAGLRWHQVGQALAAEIDNGVIAAGARLPADTDLAARFGVNRHTVRRALHDLQDKGLLRSEKGRGTFVADDVLQYRLGTRTRFTQNLLAGHRLPGRRLLSVSALPAPEAIAARLAVGPGDPLVAIVTVGEADGVPISRGLGYFPAVRVPGLHERMAGHLAADAPPLSITGVLQACGIADYRRRSTLITARRPTRDEAELLRMPRSEPVLETESLDVDEAGREITYARTAFRSGQVQFLLEG